MGTREAFKEYAAAAIVAHSTLLLLMMATLLYASTPVSEQQKDVVNIFLIP